MWPCEGPGPGLDRSTLVTSLRQPGFCSQHLAAGTPGTSGSGGRGRPQLPSLTGTFGKVALEPAAAAVRTKECRAVLLVQSQTLFLGWETGRLSPSHPTYSRASPNPCQPCWVKGRVSLPWASRLPHRSWAGGWGCCCTQRWPACAWEPCPCCVAQGLPWDEAAMDAEEPPPWRNWGRKLVRSWLTVHRKPLTL